MLCKWYPYDKDPQFGVFIQKQAAAIACYHDIVVYSSHSHSSNSREKKYELEFSEKNKVKEYRMYYRKSTGIFAIIQNTLSYLIAWKKAREVIWKNHGKPGILHAYILLRPAVLAYICSKVYRTPYVVSEQWSGYTNGNFERQSFLRRWTGKFIFAQARERIAVSDFLRSSLERHGFKTPIRVIPNVIEVQGKSFKKESDKIRILVVADLVDEIKNISGTIRAFASVLNKIENLTLEIIGHGPDEIKLKELASVLRINPTAIHFSGLKSNAEVYEALHNSDFLVMNSRFETFSLICAEALSCGKPVIATRCGGPEEFINETNGILIPAADDESLENAMEKMARTFTNYDPHSLIQDSTRKFSAETVGKMLCEVYKAIQ